MKTQQEILDNMNQYIEYLKSLPKEEAIELAKRNLIDAGILDDELELSEMYINNF